MSDKQKKSVGEGILDGLRNSSIEDWHEAYKKAIQSEQSDDEWLRELAKKANKKRNPDSQTNE